MPVAKKKIKPKLVLKTKCNIRLAKMVTVDRSKPDKSDKDSQERQIGKAERIVSAPPGRNSQLFCQNRPGEFLGP